MFKVVPSISISEGKIVLLKKGNFADKLRFNYSIVDVCKLLEDNGIDVLHFLDLDGLKAEKPVNLDTLEIITGHTNLKVDFMGGIRTDGDINKVLEYGATYFTASSVAVNDNELFASWIISYGREKLSLMSYVSEGKLVYKYIRKKVDIDLFDHIDYFHVRGLKYVKVTDLDRDSALVGPNFELYEKLKKRFPDLYIAAGGGVRSIDDIRRLRDIGIYAVIVGRSLYEERIKVEELREFAV